MAFLANNVDLLLGTNIALNKSATQGPGIYAGQTADKAVDGNTTNKNDGRCAHTTEGNTTTRAWWQVDLGDTYRITGVKIYNRDKSGRLQ